MDKKVFRLFFQLIAFLAVGVSLTACNEDKTSPEDNPLGYGEIHRELAVGETFTLSMGNYTSEDDYVGTLADTQDGKQVFTAVHVGESKLVTPNHQDSYLMIVSANVDPFDGLTTPWGESFDNMLETLGLKEDSEGVNADAQTIETIAGGMRTTYHFSNNKLEQVAVDFTLSKLSQGSMTGEEILLIYLEESFNFTNTQGIYGKYFNQYTFEKATTWIEISEIPEGTEGKEGYDHVANFYDAKKFPIE